MIGRFKRWLAKLEHKKGQMTMENGLSNALMFVVLVIAVGVGATILSGIQTGQTAGSAAANITGTGLLGLTSFSGQFQNVGLVLAAALILTVLIVGLGMFFKKE